MRELDITVGDPTSASLGGDYFLVDPVPAVCADGGGDLFLDGSVDGDAGTGTVVVSDLVSDASDRDSYPESGSVLAIVDGVRIVVTFDGRRYATVAVTAGGVTVRYTLDLETGELG